MARKLTKLEPLTVDSEAAPPVATRAADPFASIRRPRAQARLQHKIMIYPTEEEADEIKTVAQRNDVSMSGLLMLAYREWRNRNPDKV